MCALHSSEAQRLDPAQPDAALVEATLRGEIDAFRLLVDRHQDVVIRVAARVVGREEADDVSQDAFLRAFHRLEGFRDDAPFRAWLLRIAHNAAIDHLRRKPPAPVDAEAVAAGQEGGPRPPAEQMEIRERVQRLERKLRGLSPAHRTVLVLRDVEGLDYEEIATVTDSPVGSVKGRLHRARSELIEMLKSNTYDWELPE